MGLDRQPRFAITLALATCLAIGCASNDRPLERAPRPEGGGLPMAARHVPKSCHAVAHFDLSRSRAEAAAATRAVLPQDGPEEVLLAQVRALGALDLERDLSDVMLCLSVAGAEVRTVIVAGGDIPGGAVVPVLEGELDGAQVTHIGSGQFVNVMVEGRSWFAGQAPDGAIVLGDDERLIAEALPATRAAAALGMRFDLPLSLRADRPVLERALAAPGIVPVELTPLLAGATRLIASGGPELSVRVAYSDAPRAAEVAAPLRELLDRRLDESARVVARSEGADVILDVDTTHFLRSRSR